MPDRSVIMNSYLTATLGTMLLLFKIRASPLSPAHTYSVNSVAGLDLYNQTIGTIGPITCYERDSSTFGPVGPNFNTHDCEAMLNLISSEISGARDSRQWWWSEKGMEPRDLSSRAIKLPVMSDLQRANDCLLLVTNSNNLMHAASQASTIKKPIGWKDDWGKNKSPIMKDIKEDTASWYGIIKIFDDLLSCLDDGGKPGHVRFGKSSPVDEQRVASSALSIFNPWTTDF